MPLEPQKISLTDDALIVSQGKICVINNTKQTQDKLVITWITELEKEKIIAIAAGSGRKFAISSNHLVWAWGNNHFGELGLGHYDDCSSPQLVRSAIPHEIIKIVAGEHFTVWLGKSGQVWTCGGNSVGQLGTGNELDSNVLVPVVGLTKHRIIDIAASRSHVLALSDAGEVFAWGKLSSNTGLEPGTGRLLNSNRPLKLKCQDKVSRIIACTNATLVLTETGKVLACGSNDFGLAGQDVFWLGSGDLIAVSIINEPIMDLVGSKEHVIALTQNKTAYGWGRNYEFRPLGAFARYGIAVNPQLITLPENGKIAKVLVGNNTTVLVSEDEKIYLLGENLFRAQSSADDNRNDLLELIDEAQIKDLLVNGLRPEPNAQDILGTKMLDATLTKYSDITLFSSSEANPKQEKQLTEKTTYQL